MTSVIPARAHSYLVKDGPSEYDFIPIVGWLILGATQWAQPIFTVPNVQTTKRDAIMIWDEHDPQEPDGTFTHPYSGLSFNGFTNWKEYIEGIEPTGDDKAPIIHPAHDVAKRIASEPKVTKAAVVEQIFNSSGDMPEDRPEPSLEDSKPLLFGSQSYKTKSYWKWPSTKALFEIAAEQMIPADKRVEKIKRDEFFKLRREEWATINPHDGTIVKDGPEDDAAGAAETAGFNPLDLI